MPRRRQLPHPRWHLGEDQNAATESAVPTFPSVFRSNYESILLSFQDMTTAWTTDGPTSATYAYLALKSDQQK